MIAALQLDVWHLIVWATDSVVKYTKNKYVILAINQLNAQNLLL